MELGVREVGKPSFTTPTLEALKVSYGDTPSTTQTKIMGVPLRTDNWGN